MRTFSNGGGVGIFVNDDVSSKIIDIDNSFHEKIFECITIEYSNRKTYISSIYRSPSPIKNISVSDQNNLFMSKLDAHLSFLNNFGSTSYVFLDANIDLSKINNHQPANEYADIILSNGFIQSITKSTRIHGQSFSLIDHILTNDISEIPKTGVLINDISDHFITFIELQKIKKEQKQQQTKRRAFTEKNIENFRNCLRNLSWHNVYSEKDVDNSFNAFWTDFSMLYDINFPYQKFKFNKNVHKKQGFK